MCDVAMEQLRAQINYKIIIEFLGEIDYSPNILQMKIKLPHCLLVYSEFEHEISLHYDVK